MGRFATHAASTDTAPSLLPRRAVVLFCFAVLTIFVAAYLAFDAQKRDLKALAERNLADIAALKADQISQWLRERRGDATVFSEPTPLALLFDNWLRHGRKDDADRRLLLARMNAVASYYDYQALLFFDPGGQPRLSTEDTITADDREIQLALDAMRSRQVRSGDLHAGSMHRTTMGVVAPVIVGEGEHSRVAGAMYFRIDPTRFLYPLIQSWPVESQTAETLLVRRDGGDVQFLNRLRHTNAEPMSLRLPLANADLPAAQVLRGKTGFTSGIDYRGKSVVGYLLKVPGTNWGMVAKIDEAEIYAPVSRLGLYVALVMLVVLSFVVYVFWSLRMRALHIQREYQAELANRLLAKRLSDVQDEERRKLGAELHDRTAANLASVNLLLKQLAAKLPDSESAMHLMEDIQALMADTNNTIREIATNLHPPLLDYLGLEAALNELAGRFARRLGIPIHVHSSGTRRPHGATQTALYRIVEEALTNCAKHAQAQSIDINLSAAGDRMLLSIADDGLGFEPEAAISATSLGILTMRERAEFAGGSFSLVSAPGRGTTIHVGIPCVRAPTAELENSGLMSLDD